MYSKHSIHPVPTSPIIRQTPVQYTTVLPLVLQYKLLLLLYLLYLLYFSVDFINEFPSTASMASTAKLEKSGRHARTV